MKRYFTIFLLLALYNVAIAQPVANMITHNRSRKSFDLGKVNLNGQWRGSFNETTPNAYGFTDNSRTTYVLELEVNGSHVGGYSYTYFSDPGDNRYYTICRITGTLDRKSNSIVVTEVERIKWNTPPFQINCFQIHSLHYTKGDDNTEYLKGDWVPAPNQPNCSGKGHTELSRQVLSRTPFAVNLRPRKEVPKETHRAPQVHKQSQKPAIASKPAQKKVEQKPTEAITSGIPTDKKETVVPKEVSKLKTPPAPVFRGYENRKNNVLKTINIENPVFQIELYDNGEIDGDSISVFFNGNLIVSHQRLSAKAISLTLSINKDYTNNIITMYAENLGSIPPNTAVMIVRDGDKRYEVRMESDLGKSGTVVFTHNE